MKLRNLNFEFQMAARDSRNPQSVCAFTLIEIMVAIAIFSMVLMAIYSVWGSIMRASQVAQDVTAQAQRQRITLRTLEDSLMAVQSFQASPQYYSFVVGDDPEAGSLSFTARVPEIFPRNGKSQSHTLRDSTNWFHLAGIVQSMLPFRPGRVNRAERFRFLPAWYPARPLVLQRLCFSWPRAR